MGQEVRGTLRDHRSSQGPCGRTAQPERGNTQQRRVPDPGVAGPPQRSGSSDRGLRVQRLPYRLRQPALDPPRRSPGLAGSDHQDPPGKGRCNRRHRLPSRRFVARSGESRPYGLLQRRSTWTPMRSHRAALLSGTRRRDERSLQVGHTAWTTFSRHRSPAVTVERPGAGVKGSLRRFAPLTPVPVRSKTRHLRGAAAGVVGGSAQPG